MSETRERSFLVRVVLIVVGMVLLVIGIAGMFLPVLPGLLLVIPGLAILAGEFVWARRLLDVARDRVNDWRGALEGGDDDQEG